jgi:hypothetical protein
MNAIQQAAQIKRDKAGTRVAIDRQVIVQVNTRITEAMYNDLLDLCNGSNLRVADFVRVAIFRYISDMKKENPALPAPDLKAL